MSLLPAGGRVVPPEWIDYNGHMMDAYYFLAFTEATEAFLDHVGLGAAYQARTGSGIYTAESHLCFLSGVTEGAALSYQTQLLGHDARRLHVFHTMTGAGTLAATCELMFLHVSQGHVSPIPPGAARAVAALAAGQAPLPRPVQAGRRVALAAQEGRRPASTGPSPSAPAGTATRGTSPRAQDS
ncbi:MAG: thioesterase family protein [Streptosporangiaceae bacterium]